MTLHVSRLPFALDPLIGEAKRRARRRRVLLALAVVLAAAAGTAFALRPSGGPGISLPQRPIASSHGTLAFGSRGPEVAAWQRVLNAWLGGQTTGDRWLRAAHARVGPHIEVNGIFGPSTVIATRYEQRDAHEDPTGVVTNRTWIAWVGANVTCCGAGLPNFTSREVRQLGVRPVGYVGWWQHALNLWRAKRGFHPVLVDGVYNAQTRAATQAFQRSVGLPETGVADAATWREAQHIGILRFP